MTETKGDQETAGRPYGGARRATIGRSLFIKGEVTGNEDLTIDGRVEGRIILKDHDLVVGETSRLSAEVRAKNITIYGEATGDMVADERVTLADSGRLVGNIKAPRIAISDGATFRGNVDMMQMADEKPGARTKVLKQTAGVGGTSSGGSDAASKADRRHASS